MHPVVLASFMGMGFPYKKQIFLVSVWVTESPNCRWKIYEDDTLDPS